MSDESKVKTTCILPVNRTMSYEDRRGYICMYVCMYVCNVTVYILTFPVSSSHHLGHHNDYRHCL